MTAADHGILAPAWAATGVDGVCVVSALCTAEDPAAAARRLRAAIEGVRV